MNDDHIDPEEFARLTCDGRHIPAEIEDEEPRYELTPLAQAYLAGIEQGSKDRAA